MFGTILPIRKRREDEPERRSGKVDFFEEFFDSALGGFGWAPFAAPSLDICETDDEVLVTTELPGMNPTDVDLSLDGDVLAIRGEKKEEKSTKDKRYTRQERRYGSFTRSVMLPGGVKADEVKADFKDGVLTVHLPKDQTSKTRRIAICD